MGLYKLKVKLSTSLLVVSALLSCSTKADVLIKTEGVYFQNLTSSIIPSYSVSYFDLSSSLTLSQRSSFSAGLVFSTLSTNEKDSSGTTTYWTEQNTGLNLGWKFGVTDQFCLSGIYILASNSSYKQGSSQTEFLNGSGYAVKFSHLSVMTKKIHISVSIIYAQNTYVTSRVGTTITNINRVKTYFVPVLGAQYTF